jgi:hypothetical protein
MAQSEGATWHPQNAQGGPVTKNKKIYKNGPPPNLAEVPPYLAHPQSLEVRPSKCSRGYNQDPKGEARGFDPGPPPHVTP